MKGGDQVDSGLALGHTEEEAPRNLSSNIQEIRQGLPSHPQEMEVFFPVFR